MGNTTLVLGATGNVGKFLVQTLSVKGHRVKAATRHPDTYPNLSHVTPVRFFYDDPATFEGALEDVDQVFVVSPPGYADVVGLLGPFLDKAFSRVSKIVALSAQGVEFNEEAPLRKLERRIERSGLAHVFLRAGWFADNFHTFWLAPIRAAHVIPLPAADSKTAFIDARDIAASAAAVLTSKDFDGQAFTLTGAEALTYAQAAQVLSDVADRPIVYQPIDDGSFRNNLIQAGVPADYAQLLVALFGYVRQGAASVPTDHVARLTGQQPRSLSEYANFYAQAWR